MRAWQMAGTDKACCSLTLTSFDGINPLLYIPAKARMTGLWAARRPVLTVPADRNRLDWFTVLDWFTARCRRCAATAVYSGTAAAALCCDG